MLSKSYHKEITKWFYSIYKNNPKKKIQLWETQKMNHTKPRNSQFLHSPQFDQKNFYESSTASTKFLIYHSFPSRKHSRNKTLGWIRMKNEERSWMPWVHLRRLHWALSVRCRYWELKEMLELKKLIFCLFFWIPLVRQLWYYIFLLRALIWAIALIFDFWFCEGICLFNLLIVFNT